MLEYSSIAAVSSLPFQAETTSNCFAFRSKLRETERGTVLALRDEVKRSIKGIIRYGVHEATRSIMGVRSKARSQGNQLARFISTRPM